jgi:hypothetical protein
MRTGRPIDEPLRSDEALSAYGTARSTVEESPLSPDELRKIDAYWRASLYLCLGVLYPKTNPLLREPLAVGRGHAVNGDVLVFRAGISSVCSPRVGSVSTRRAAATFC